jgi:TolB protein
VKEAQMKTKVRTGWGLAVAAGLVAVLVGSAALSAQDWFRTGTGMGVSKVRLALPDYASANAATQPMAQVFNQVLWADLDYSGAIEMVSKSFYPLPSTWPSQPSQLQGQQQQWSQPPVNAAMISFGSLTTSGTNLSVSTWLEDVTNPAAPPVLAKVFSGGATVEGARLLAHQVADAIVSALTGGVAGIAETHIAYTHQVGNIAELWVMDYDGANAHRITHLGTESITPRWSPDAMEIAFTCFVPYRGVVSAQICLYSMPAGRVLYFRRFPGTNATPAWSPSGRQIAFMSSMRGDPEIWVANSDGNSPKELTFALHSVNTSPVWNPKTGQEIVFVSDRGGLPGLYMMNADGSDVVKIDLPDMGYVVDPTWSPNAQLLAFSWRRPNGNYDIYVMDIASHQLLQLTRDAGRNERPGWAPDGRHLVFQSDRTGSRQVWTMLADGSQARQLTRGAENFSPSWSPK